MQVEDGDVWREVRDGACSGGGETGPIPQLLSRRLEGLKAANSGGSGAPDLAEVRVSGERATAISGEVKGEEHASGGDLRLEDPGDKPLGLQGDTGSPTREPPKTPKRTKASSPQLSDVSADAQ